MKPINLLILDEPTNHLDIRSKEVLKQAIMDYDGTLIVVSHDRDFLSGLTDKTVEFDNKKIKTYLGDINYFLEKRDYANLRDVSLGKNANLNAVNKLTEAPGSKAAEKPAPKAVAQPKAEKTLTPEQQTKLKGLRKQIQQCEKKINKLEDEIAKQEILVADPALMSTAKYPEILAKYKQLKQQLDEVVAEWENAEMEKESLEG